MFNLLPFSTSHHKSHFATRLLFFEGKAQESLSRLWVMDSLKQSTMILAVFDRPNHRHQH
jgi:hypothetical protein